jgi:hypothetical protein
LRYFYSPAKLVACAAVNPNAVGVALIKVLKLFDHVMRLASRPGRKLAMICPRSQKWKRTPSSESHDFAATAKTFGTLRRRL